MIMDKAIFRKCLSTRRSVNVEFKECNTALNQSVFDTVCSFSNRLGGYIFLGVKDSGEVIGVEPTSIQRIKREFANNLNNPQKINPPLYIQLKEFVYEDKVVLYAYIPESSSVHTLNGSKIFDRNKDGDYDITSNQNLIAKMYARKSNRNSEDRIIGYAKESWFDFETVKMAKSRANNVNSQNLWSPRDKLFKEAVVNFLIHREYSDAYISSMVIEKNKVTFKNAANPSYIGRVDIDDFNPEPKNPTIARVFRLMGLADELGSGFRNIKKYCKIYANSTPIVLDGDVFTLVIPLQSEQKVKEERTTVKEKILDYVVTNREITNKDVRDSFGLERTRAAELLSELMDENLLRREGSGRGTQYVSAKG